MYNSSWEDEKKAKHLDGQIKRISNVCVCALSNWIFLSFHFMYQSVSHFQFCVWTTWRTGIFLGNDRISMNQTVRKMTSNYISFKFGQCDLNCGHLHCWTFYRIRHPMVWIFYKLDGYFSHQFKSWDYLIIGKPTLRYLRPLTSEFF